MIFLEILVSNCTQLVHKSMFEFCLLTLLYPVTLLKSFTSCRRFLSMTPWDFLHKPQITVLFCVVQSMGLFFLLPHCTCCNRSGESQLPLFWILVSKPFSLSPLSIMLARFLEMTIIRLRKFSSIASQPSLSHE